MLTQTILPTKEDISFWNENGYWISDKVLDDDFLERLRNAMYRIWAAEFETGKEPWGGPWRLGDNPLSIRKMDQAHWTNNTMRELVTNEVIGEMAAKLSGESSIKLWHDQLLYKPGQGSQAAGANVGWHQDNNYWKCADDRLLTAWVAFDDVSVENGCMQVVPKSHKWGRIEGNFFDQDMDNYKKNVEEQTGHEFKTVPLEMKAGCVSFHHCLTIHGSGPNMTNRPRRSLVLHLMPGDATYIAGTDNDNHMNAILMRELGKKDGDVYEGEYWPYLFK